MAAGMSMMGQVLVKAALMLRIKDLTEVRFGILHAANCNDHDRGWEGNWPRRVLRKACWEASSGPIIVSTKPSATISMPLCSLSES